MSRRRIRVASWEETLRYGAKLPRGVRPRIAGAAGPALVGSLGAVALGTSTTINPAWGTGATRTAVHLLVFYASVTGGTPSSIATPAGWTVLKAAAEGSNSSAAAIFAKKAAGADAAPGVTVVGAGAVMLAEFSGVGIRVDESGVLTNATNYVNSPGPTLALPAADKVVGELLLAAWGTQSTDGTMPNGTMTFNNGAAAAGVHGTNGSGVYSFGWGVTTSKAAADQVSLAAYGVNGGTWSNTLVLVSMLGAGARAMMLL